MQIVNGILLGLGVYIFRAYGDPSTSPDPNVAEASAGSLYLRIDGGSGSTLYVREPSGWVAK